MYASKLFGGTQKLDHALRLLVDPSSREFSPLRREIGRVRGGRSFVASVGSSLCETAFVMGVEVDENRILQKMTYY